MRCPVRQGGFLRLLSGLLRVRVPSSASAGVAQWQSTYERLPALISGTAIWTVASSGAWKEPIFMAKGTLEERFFAKVDAEGPCWEWTGARMKNGYGVFNRGKPAG